MAASYTLGNQKKMKFFGCYQRYLLKDDGSQIVERRKDLVRRPFIT